MKTLELLNITYSDLGPLHLTGIETDSFVFEDDNGLIFRLSSVTRFTTCSDEVRFDELAEDYDYLKDLTFTFSLDDFGNNINIIPFGGITITPDNSYPIFIPGYKYSRSVFPESVLLVLEHNGVVLREMDVTPALPLS